MLLRANALGTFAATLGSAAPRSAGPARVWLTLYCLVPGALRACACAPGPVAPTWGACPATALQPTCTNIAPRSAPWRLVCPANTLLTIGCGLLQAVPRTGRLCPVQGAWCPVGAWCACLPAQGLTGRLPGLPGAPAWCACLVRVTPPCLCDMSQARRSTPSLFLRKPYEKILRDSRVHPPYPQPLHNTIPRVSTLTPPRNPCSSNKTPKRNKKRTRGKRQKETRGKMVRAFNITLPANGSVVTLESEATEGAQSFNEAFSSQGGTVFLRNTSATVNAVWGGNDQQPNMPINTGDPMTPPIPLGPNDSLTAKISSGSTAGQITVVQITR